jgi:hypothetical protein
MAAVFWASFRRRAMVWRRRVIFTRSSRSTGLARSALRPAPAPGRYGALEGFASASPLSRGRPCRCLRPWPDQDRFSPASAASGGMAFTSPPDGFGGSCPKCFRGRRLICCSSTMQPNAPADGFSVNDPDPGVTVRRLPIPLFLKDAMRPERAPRRRPCRFRSLHKGLVLFTASPGCTSQDPTVPSDTLSPITGTFASSQIAAPQPAPPQALPLQTWSPVSRTPQLFILGVRLRAA